MPSASIKHERGGGPSKKLRRKAARAAGGVCLQLGRIDHTRPGHLCQRGHDFLLQRGGGQQAAEEDGIALRRHADFCWHVQLCHQGAQQGAFCRERRLEAFRPYDLWRGAQRGGVQLQVWPQLRHEAPHCVRLRAFRQPAGDVQGVIRQRASDAGRHLELGRAGLQAQRAQGADGCRCPLHGGGVFRLPADHGIPKPDLHHGGAHAGGAQAAHGLIMQRGQVILQKQPRMHACGHRQQDQHEEDEAEAHGTDGGVAFDTAETTRILRAPRAGRVYR